MRLPSRPSSLFGTGLILLLAACGGGAAPASVPAPASSAPSSAAAKPATSAAASLAVSASAAAKPSAPAAAASASAAAKPAAAKEPVKIEFMMPWILPTEYFYFLTADTKGYFKDEGIQIHLNEGSGSGNTVKVVGAADARGAPR